MVVFNLIAVSQSHEAMSGNSEFFLSTTNAKANDISTNNLPYLNTN